MALTTEQILKVRDAQAQHTVETPAGVYDVVLTNGFLQYAEVLSAMTGTILPHSGVGMASGTFNGARVLLIGQKKLSPQEASIIVRRTLPLHSAGAPYAVILCSDKETCLCVGAKGTWAYMSEKVPINPQTIKRGLLEAFAVDRDLRNQINTFEMWDSFDLGGCKVHSECWELNDPDVPNAFYRQTDTVYREE